MSWGDQEKSFVILMNIVPSTFTVRKLNSTTVEILHKSRTFIKQNDRMILLGTSPLKSETFTLV